MKNFSEVTAIKDMLTLEVKIKLTPVNKCYCAVNLNDKECLSTVLVTPVEIVQHIPLNDPLKLDVLVKRLHPHAVIIEVIVDGYQLLPLYENYAEPCTNYLDFNGNWNFYVPNFYQWYHNVSGRGWIA
jgi:hypothetical protein